MPKYQYCPHCSSTKIIKKGKRRRIQKYHCQTCLKWFQSKRQPSRQSNWLVNQLTFKKTSPSLI